MPSWRSASGPTRPAADSISQRSPHRVNDSTWDGDSRSSSSGPATGSGLDKVVSAYHRSGWAPRTPAAASRASWAAAASRTAAGRLASAAARRRSAVSAGSDSQRCPWPLTRSTSMSSPASSARNRDGRSSLSSADAVTIRRLRARVTAT